VLLELQPACKDGLGERKRVSGRAVTDGLNVALKTVRYTRALTTAHVVVATT